MGDEEAIRKTKSRLPLGKYKRWKYLYALEDVKNHLPITRIYLPRNLYKFLRLWRIIFLKPNKSESGEGVMKIQKEGHHLYVHYQDIQYVFEHSREFDQWLTPMRRNRLFLMQQGINLARINGNPVDIRAIIQLNKSGMWELTGIYARMAKAGFSITNIEAGGQRVPIQEYLHAVEKDPHIQNIYMSKMEKVAVNVGNALGKQFRNTVYGVDLGIDITGKIWIIEVNTQPTLKGLASFDAKMYLKIKEIIRYHKNKEFLSSKKSI